MFDLCRTYSWQLSGFSSFSKTVSRAKKFTPKVKPKRHRSCFRITRARAHNKRLGTFGHKMQTTYSLSLPNGLSNLLFTRASCCASSHFWGISQTICIVWWDYWELTQLSFPFLAWVPWGLEGCDLIIEKWHCAPKRPRPLIGGTPSGLAVHAELSVP